MVETKLPRVAHAASQVSKVHARSELHVHDPVERTIELGWVGAAVEHRQVISVDPVLLLAQLELYHVVELCPRQGVRHGNADIVRSAAPHHGQGRLNIAPVLIWISELQEEACPDAGLTE